MPALTQASSLSPPGAPATAMLPIVSSPALIGTPPGPVARFASNCVGLNAPGVVIRLVKSVVETADTTYVVIPYLASEGELSDADLEKVAGGFKDITAQCDNAGGGIGASVNTVVQINA